MLSSANNTFVSSAGSSVTVSGTASLISSGLASATEAGFEAAKIGARVSDVFTAMWGVLEAGGALGNDVGRLGHGLGMQLTEPPSNTGDDHTVIAENMVLTLEPGMTFSPGKVMVHEENIVITKTGARYLSRRAAAALPIIA